MAGRRAVARLRSAARRATHGRARLVAGGVAAVGIAAAGAVGALVRRRAHPAVDFGDPGERAAEAARSVHNAAKGTVITTVRGRAAHERDEDLVTTTVHDAMREAARSGADVTAVASGVVEGAAEVAHLVGVRPHELASIAARSAVDAATSRGDIAADRVQQLLSRHLAE